MGVPGMELHAENGLLSMKPLIMGVLGAVVH